MAKVPLSPIGSPRDAVLDAALAQKNRSAMHALDEALEARRRWSRAAGARNTSSACTRRAS